MKKIIYSISVLLTSVFFTRSAYAVWPDLTPVIPFSPQFCVMCIPPAISVAVSYYDQVVELKEDLEKYTDMTTLKQMAVSYAFKMGTTSFNKWRQDRNTRERGVEHARVIEKSKIADMKDETSVKNAFVKLFLQYPSNKANTREAYRSIGNQLKMDTTLEMYITAVEMEKKLYGNTPSSGENTKNKNWEDLGMLKQIDLIESCLVGGENCDIVGLSSCQESAGKGADETKEDQACFWNSAIQAEKLYDEIMRNNLLLITMLAQYKAVMGIEELAKIKEYEEEEKSGTSTKKEDKSSFVIEKYLQPSYNSAMSEISAKVAFADSIDEDKEAEAELSGYNEDLVSQEDVVDGTFEDTDNPKGVSSVISEREDDVKSLQIIGEIREDLNKAQRIHNLKQTLPEYKKVYEDYANAKEKMEQAKADLQASGECVINLLKPYYKNADAVWFGKNCAYYRSGQVICHYEPEKTDDNEMSDGLFDIPCPGDGEHYCYVQELRSSNLTGGVANYVASLYSAAKDEDAAGDTEAFIEVEQSDREGGFGSSAKISTGGKGSEVEHGEDDLFATTRDSDEKMDGAMADKMTTQTSDNGSDKSVSNLKNQEKGEEEKEQARKDGLIRWVIGSEVAKELAVDLDTGEHHWGDRQQKFPLWNDQIAFYNQYIEGKYDNIEEYIQTMTQADVLWKLADVLNLIYPYKVIPGIPPISAEAQRKKAEDLLKKLGKALTSIKKEIIEKISGSDAKNAGSDSDLENTDLADLEMKQIETEIENSEKRLAQIKYEYEQKSKSKKAELNNWYAIMDEANTKLSQLNETYNKSNEVVKKGDATTPEASEGIEYSSKIYGKRKLSKDSPQNADFNTTKTDNAKNSVVARATQTAMANKGKDYEQIVKVAEGKVAKIKEDLEKMRTEYVKRISDAETQEKTNFATFTEELRAARQIGVLADTSAQVLPLELSGKLLQCVRVYALSKVAEARTEIHKMEEDLSIYYAESAPRVQEIHNKMIESITNIPLTELAECAAIGEIQSFDEKSDEDIAPVINVFKEICTDDFCTTPDEEYFVGAIGLPRDFSAPKSPLEFSSAPLREVFHFDISDFNNVDKYYPEKEDVYSNKKMYISFESFLNFLNANSTGFEYGNTSYDSTVPAVWKYILKRHAFVQKEMDLKPLLGDGEDTENNLNGELNFEDGRKRTLERSGIFPCLVEDKYIVDNKCVTKSQTLKLGKIMPVNKQEAFCVYKKTANAGKAYDYLPTCRATSLDKETSKSMVSDKEIGMTYKFGRYMTLPIKQEQGSELGRILSYVIDEPEELSTLLKSRLFPEAIDKSKLPRRLTFNQTLLDAIATVNKTEDLNKDEEATKFYDASRVLFDRNQFGDYLDQVEYESIVADSMEKIEKQIEEINGKLAEVLNAADYTMSDEFSLLNEKDYNEAARVMDEQKNLYIDLAIQKLQTLPQGSGESQNVRDKSLKLLHKIAVLQKDNEEIVTVTGEEELDELEEKMKSQKADQAVVDIYKEKGKQEDERQKKRARVPYCASYPVIVTKTSDFSETKTAATGSDKQADVVEEEQMTIVDEPFVEKYEKSTGKFEDSTKKDIDKSVAISSQKPEPIAQSQNNLSKPIVQETEKKSNLPVKTSPDMMKQTGTLDDEISDLSNAGNTQIGKEKTPIKEQKVSTELKAEEKSAEKEASFLPENDNSTRSKVLNNIGGWGMVGGGL